MAMLTKHPIQIYLDKEQDDALRRLSEERQVSIAALIRESVDLMLSKLSAENDPAWDIIGIGSSAIADLGEAHDQYIVETLEEETK